MVEGVALRGRDEETEMRLRKETLLIGTRDELVDYFRNELGVLTKEQANPRFGEGDPMEYVEEIGKRLDDMFMNGYKKDVIFDSKAETVEEQLDEIIAKQPSFGPVFYLDVSAADCSGEFPNIQMVLRDVFVWIEKA